MLNVLSEKSSIIKQDHCMYNWFLFPDNIDWLNETEQTNTSYCLLCWLIYLAYISKSACNKHVIKVYTKADVTTNLW